MKTNDAASKPKAFSNVLFSLVLIGSLFISGLSFAEKKDWFKSLQNALQSVSEGGNTSVLDNVVSNTLSSGVQIYVVIQTAVAIDSNAVDQVLKSITRVTKDPGNVVKSSILANIPVPMVLSSVLSASTETETIIASAINAGAPIETVMSSCLKAGAQPMVVVSACIASSRNISGVVEASVKTGVPPNALLQAALSNNIKDLDQVVSAYINAGGDVNRITAAAIDMGSDTCAIIAAALSSSNEYHQVVKAALEMNVSANQIMECAAKVPTIDKKALASAIETAQAALAYTPPDNRRGRQRRDNMHRERRRGNVSVY